VSTPTTDLQFVPTTGGYDVRRGDAVIGYVSRSPINPTVWNAWSPEPNVRLLGQRSTRALAAAVLDTAHQADTREVRLLCWILYRGDPSGERMLPVTVIVGTQADAHVAATRLNRDHYTSTGRWPEVDYIVRLFPTPLPVDGPALELLTAVAR
jgi:hypothetical protein